MTIETIANIISVVMLCILLLLVLPETYKYRLRIMLFSIRIHRLQRKLNRQERELSKLRNLHVVKHCPHRKVL